MLQYRNVGIVNVLKNIKETKMKKIISKLFIAFITVFLSTMVMPSSVFATPLGTPAAGNWKICETNYLFIAGTSTYTTNLYFKDKISAIKFADELTTTNTETTTEFILSTALGAIPGTYGLVGVAAGGLSAIDTNIRSSLCASIKEDVYSTTKGYICVTMRKTETPRGVEMAPTTTSVPWNGVTVISSKGSYTSAKYTY